MPVSFTIYPDKCLVLVKLAGHVTLPDLMYNVQQMRSHPLFSEEFPRIIDALDMTAGLSGTDVRDFARLIVRASSTNGGSRRAIVAKDDVVFGLSKMLESLTTPGTDAWRAFRNMGEALEWLGVADTD